MIRTVKAVSFLLVSLFFASLSFAVHLSSLVSGRAPYKPLSFLTRSWGRMMMRLLNIRCSPVSNETALSAGSCLAVSNHIGYLDIIVIASCVPTLFIAKSDVAQWPLLGWVSRLGGTIFVDRRSQRGGIRSVKRISTVLSSGAAVTLFPEGTSTDGTTVLPFKPSIFTAALDAQAPVQPLTIRYLSVDGNLLSDANRDIVCWYGAMDFAAHFWNLLGVHRVDAELIVHDRIPFHPGSTPRDLALQTRTIILSRL